MLRRGCAFLSKRNIDLKVDVCVLGGGPAGIAAALRAVDYNKQVCLIEKHEIGGRDLHKGTIQSKTLWQMAKFHASMRGSTIQRIMDKPKLELCHERIQATLQEGSSKRQSQILEQLTKANVNLLSGQGMFASPYEVDVMNNDGTFTKVHADYIVIATGSVPRQHPQFPTDGKYVMTTDEIMSYELPKSLVVVGAGVIGVEFASILANFGTTQVNVVERRGRILPGEDDDVAMTIQGALEAKGVRFHRHASLRNLEVVDGHVKYTIKDNKEDEHHTFEVERALISIGRRPLYSHLGLENTSIRVENGVIQRDRFLRCEPHRHIYACGDAISTQKLVNAAEHQALGVIDHMYSTKPQDRDMRYENLSTIHFLDQEVAAVGMNETECRTKNIAYVMARYSYQYVSRAVAMNKPKGFVKIIVTNDREKRMLGMRAVGPHASSIVELAALAIHNKQSAYELSDLLTAYPAVAQGFQECVRMLLGRSILKPSAASGNIVTKWEPEAFSRGRAYHTVEKEKTQPEVDTRV
jgi:dihydrolipoamide dehydrogenase